MKKLLLLWISLFLLLAGQAQSTKKPWREGEMEVRSEPAEQRRKRLGRGAKRDPKGRGRSRRRRPSVCPSVLATANVRCNATTRRSAASRNVLPRRSGGSALDGDQRGLRMRRDRGRNSATLLIDGEPAGGFDEQLGFVSFISWSGLDIGRDRSSPVSHYEAPFAFTGKLRKVTFTLDDDQALDAKAAADAALARE